MSGRSADPIQAGVHAVAIRILLADDHTLVRNGLRAMVDRHPDLEVVGEASDGRSALRAARELEPDVVIVDISMPGLNGIEATRQITADLPAAKVVVLSMHADRRFVREALAAGASAYLLKASAFEDVVKAIEAVTADRFFASPEIADVVVEDYVRHLNRPGPAPRSPLTPREREVLQLLAEGNSTRQIASTLHVSVNTIDTHRRRIMEKLDLHSVAELTKYAIREGLTSVDS